MPKKVVSLALSEKSIEKLDKTSKALGMNRSELMDFLIEKGFQFPKEVEKSIDEISRLQEDTKDKIKNRRK